MDPDKWTRYGEPIPDYEQKFRDLKKQGKCIADVIKLYIDYAIDEFKLKDDQVVKDSIYDIYHLVRGDERFMGKSTRGIAAAVFFIGIHKAIVHTDKRLRREFTEQNISNFFNIGTEATRSRVRQITWIINNY